MKARSYEDLTIWQTSISLAKNVFVITNTDKFKKEYVLKDQIKRSALSIPSNIAEGFERNTNPEFKRFLLIAKGSTAELRTQLYIAKEQNLISTEDYETLNEMYKKLAFSIGALIKYLRKNISRKPNSLNSRNAQNT